MTLTDIVASSGLYARVQPVEVGLLDSYRVGDLVSNLTIPDTVDVIATRSITLSASASTILSLSDFSITGEADPWETSEGVDVSITTVYAVLIRIGALLVAETYPDVTLSGTKIGAQLSEEGDCYSSVARKGYLAVGHDITIAEIGGVAGAVLTATIIGES